MGLYDRDYTRENYVYRFQGTPQMRLGFPRLTPMVKLLLIANVAVHFIQVLGAHVFLTDWFSVCPASFLMAIQLWRLITYQFLHGSFMHILFNMLGLYFLGPTLERHWGSKRFLMFYLGCGVAGGLFYTLLVAVHFLPAVPMIGASGAILGMLAACAILFPNFVVFIFLFPVPIRVAAVALTVIYVLAVLSRATNAGGDAAHLAGMAAGAAYVFSEGWRERIKFQIRSSTRKRKIADQRKLQFEVDRILKKVHDHGIQSLTSAEKRILREATKAEQMRKGL
jgi:membrane associated rhomboid family serine protease